MSFHFLSVGIDVGADFSWFSILTPDHAPAVKPFRVTHLSLSSLEKAVSTIRKAEERYSMKARIFMESTGIYHFPLFCYLKESEFEVFVLNPLITDSNKNSAIRKVKNDRNDSLRIARTGYDYSLKTSLIPDELVLNLRTLVREHFHLTDAHAALVNKLHTALRTVFPAYLGVFSSLCGQASLTLLKTYQTPQAILDANKDDVIALICSVSRRALSYGEKKYGRLVDAARNALSFGCRNLHASFFLIQLDISLLETYEKKQSEIDSQIQALLLQHQDELFVQQIHLLDSIPNIGLLSAAALMCEIGDFSAFSRPKQLYAYFGLDPAVKESGKFKGTKVSMSKRGSHVARRVLYTIALASVRRSVNGDPTNPVLLQYYEQKKLSKPKMVALGAVMHKLSNIIFAVLREGKPFVLLTPEQHSKNYFALNAAA